MKTEDRGSAVQYASAILQLTDKSGSAEAVYKNLELVVKVFSATELLSVFFKHPGISAADKKEVLKVITGSLDQLTGRLLELLCERRKLSLLPAILDAYRDALRAKHNIVTGTLYSAEEVSDEAVQSIKQRLVKQLRKHVELAVQVDRSLIGGYTLRIGDQVIDGSLKGRLQTIEKTLLAV